jgi:hypothetical protein
MTIRSYTSTLLKQGHETNKLTTDWQLSKKYEMMLFHGKYLTFITIDVTVSSIDYN